MPDQTPAETLTAAATALRDAANATRYEIKTGTYWRGLEPGTAWERGITNAVGGWAGGFCAVMSPDVALALADWLDVYAGRFAIWKGPHISAELGHALAVARVVLGEVTQ